LKFYIEYNDSENKLLKHLQNETIQKYKFRFLWELREFEERVNADNGSFLFADYRIEYHGHDRILAAEIEAKIQAIDWSTW
jgi:hypothetical protein